MNSREYQNQYMQIPVYETDDPRLENAAPCPFCGGRCVEFSRMQNFVHCRTCGADGPEVDWRRDHHDLWRETLARWNRRT
jgi:Restriction alleviation protein Lar